MTGSFLAFSSAAVLDHECQQRDLLTKDRPLDTSERLMDVSIFALECVIQQSLKAHCINKTQSDSTEKLFKEHLWFLLPGSGKERDE